MVAQSIDQVKKEAPSRRRAAAAMLIGGYANTGIVTIQAFVLVPIVLRIVGTSIYGAWLGSGNIVGWLGVLEMGTASIMIQRIASAYGRSDRQSMADYFVTGLIVQGMLVVLFMAGASVLAPFVPKWMGIHEPDGAILSWCFVLASFANCLSILNNGVAGFAQAMQRTIFLNIVTAVCTLIGFGTTIALLISGDGLWSLPLGLIVRNVILLSANGIYARRIYRTYVAVSARISPEVVRDLRSLVGPVFLANLGNAAMSKSDVALVAILIRPEAATIYALTRRAAEVIMMLLDRTGAAVFGGFAHLVGSGSHLQARKVYRDLIYKQISIAAIMLSTFLAFNRTFVSLWVGQEQFGGLPLSSLLGFGVVGASVAGTMGYLYGATGRIVRGSYVILGEAIARFLLMVILLLTTGVIGPAIATLATSLGSGWIYYKFTLRELDGVRAMRNTLRINVWIYVCLLLVGIALGFGHFINSWGSLVLAMGVYGVSASAVAIFADPLQADIRRQVHSRVTSLFHRPP